MVISTTAASVEGDMTGVITVMKKYARMEYMNIWNTELSATSTAQYSQSPSASMFHTRTIAMHLASPIRIRPFLNDAETSSLPGNASQASANIRTGPIAQFSRRDVLS